MNRKSSQVRGNGRTGRDQSLEQDFGLVLKQSLKSDMEELLWIAEVMSGNRLAAERCVTEAIDLADRAEYVRGEWILPWAKRLLVHVALTSVSGEIRRLLPPARTPRPAKPATVGVSAFERQKLRSISAQQIIASCNVLERACFILSVYLQYPLLDCALLLGCPCEWIEPICERAFMILGVALSAQDQLPGSDSFVSSGVMGCPAD